MSPLQSHIARSRREFLTTSASGLGGIALGSMLAQDGILSAATAKDPAEFERLKPHHNAKAKACIFIFMAGAPSHLDLFDPKPKLNELHGQKLPQELIEKARFAFIQPDTATLMGSSRKWKKHGECGMEFSDLLPHLGGCADDILM
ncbi:MAG: DUF1501 domain-containing protein, partial [Verrucomicrobiae bacterium]|nr:DUF1501 domain-containing protein [Verrucomicrobiae bacterium]